MKSTHYQRGPFCWKMIVFLVLLLLVATSCFKYDGELLGESSFGVRLYRPELQIDGVEEPVLEVYDRGGAFRLLLFGAFDAAGQPVDMSLMVFVDQQAEQALYTIYDRDRQPAFSYRVDTRNGRKAPWLIEYELEDDSTFSYRIYEMDWILYEPRLSRILTVGREADGTFSPRVLYKDGSGPSYRGALPRLLEAVDWPAPPQLDDRFANPYANIVANYGAPQLIYEGMEWLNTLSDSRIDSIVTPRFDPVEAALGSVDLGQAMEFLRLGVESAGIEGRPVEIPVDIPFWVTNNKPEPPSSLSAAPLDLIRVLATQFGGTWEGERREWSCTGDGPTQSAVSVNLLINSGTGSITLTESTDGQVYSKGEGMLNRHGSISIEGRRFYGQEQVAYSFREKPEMTSQGLAFSYSFTEQDAACAKESAYYLEK